MNRVTARDAVSQDAEQYPDIAWSGAYDERGRLDWEGAPTAEGQRWSVYDHAEPGWLTGATSSENGVESSRTWAYDAGCRRESSTLDGATEGPASGSSVRAKHQVTSGSSGSSVRVQRQS